MLMKLMISLVLLSSWWPFCAWSTGAMGTGPDPAELQTKRGLPVLGCFTNLCCKKLLPPDLLSYPIFISVKARQPKKPLFNLLRLIWLVFTVWRNKPRGRGEKDHTHLGTAFFFFSARCNCISLVLLKLSKHRHLKISWAAPCLHMEPMLDTDPRTSK